MTDASRVSVIIPVREITAELRETLTRLALLSPPAGETLVLPDESPRETFPGARCIPTGVLGPAAKRDLALQHARGEIFAFLDDDAYPAHDWLAAALPHFADPKVAAVGGPAVTPSGEAFWPAVAGAVLSSWLGSGPTRMRFVPVGSVRAVDDWPSVNLLVRRDVFAAVGGFGSSFWPGEDTKLCLEIVRRGFQILYDPEVVVYHHRATTPLRHLRQFARYGLHRGYFVRQYPETSRRPYYALSTVVTLLAGIGIFLFGVVPELRSIISLVVLGVLALVLAGGVVEARRLRRPAVALVFPLLLVATHVTYGLAFLRGLLIPSLKRYGRRER